MYKPLFRPQTLRGLILYDTDPQIEAEYEILRPWGLVETVPAYVTLRPYVEGLEIKTEAICPLRGNVKGLKVKAVRYPLMGHFSEWTDQSVPDYMYLFATGGSSEGQLFDVFHVRLGPDIEGKIYGHEAHGATSILQLTAGDLAYFSNLSFREAVEKRRETRSQLGASNEN